MRWLSRLLSRRAKGLCDSGSTSVRQALVKDIPAPGVRLAVELGMEILGCRVADVRTGSTPPASDAPGEAMGDMPMGLGQLMHPRGPAAEPEGVPGTLNLEVTYRVVVREMRVVGDQPACIEFSV